MGRTVATTWYGTFVIEDGRLLRSTSAPGAPAELAARAKMRHDGRLTPEEETVLRSVDPTTTSTRDRRLADHGLRLDPGAPALPPPEARVGDRTPLRAALMAEADRAVGAAWDPSVHVEEAVRAAADLDRVRNLVGERLGSWVSRDVPEVDPGDHVDAARAAIDGAGDPRLGPPDPRLTAARRRLAELYRSLDSVRDDLAGAVERSLPSRVPNLSALLGPALAARLLAQAGGLDRLARLPSSTIQVLGAEAAFFEHLRGRAPPPRHGLLFLHPAIQSAPRRERGRLARTLAGKTAIAARLDRAGAPIDASLAAAFDARRSRLSAERARAGSAGRRSRKPLHGAAGDR